MRLEAGRRRHRGERGLIEGLLLFGGCIGLWRLLRGIEGKPSRCPNCSARTLMPDRDGYIWRCVPCEAQYRWVLGTFEPIYQDRPRGDEAVPTATLRRRDDSDKVDP